MDATRSEPIQVEHDRTDERGEQEEKRPDAEKMIAALNAPSAVEILAENRIISHGMGKIDGVTTLNCLEGFQTQYAQGVRVFEVDLRMTADLQVVLRHDWRAGWQEDISETRIPTLEEFRAKPLMERYTALSFRDLLFLMVEYPDICVITDTKFTDAEMVTVQFEAMLQDARELGLSGLFDRIVVQVYNELMFKVVDNLGHFPHYIYTLYNTGFNQSVESFEQAAVFCSENGIGAITMWSYWWKEAFAPIAQKHSLEIYVHTVNDVKQARSVLERGISAIYTDELTEEQLKIPALPERKDNVNDGNDRKETFR